MLRTFHSQVKEKISSLLLKIPVNRLSRFLSLSIASLLGILSPLCLFGTLPLAKSLKEGGLRDDILSSFIVSSILLNPQLALYSFALGEDIAIIRIVLTFVAGLLAGFIFKREFFTFSSFSKRENHDIDPNPLFRYLKNVGRNLKISLPYLALGVLLSAFFQRYIPSELVEDLLGSDSHFAIILASAFGVPVYACGGAVIPLLQLWLYMGMSKGSAITFLNVGQSLRLTNISALKMALKGKDLALFVIYIFSFSIITGYLADLIIF